MTNNNNDLDNVPHSPLDQDQRSAKNAAKPPLSPSPNVTLDWERIEADRRAQIEHDWFEHFVKRYAPDDPRENARFVSDLHYLVTSAIEHRTNAITRMYASAVACQPFAPTIVTRSPS